MKLIGVSINYGSGIISDYQIQLKESEEKLDRLLEGYLDKVISPEDYQKKKNEIVETKSLLNSKIKEISTNGVEWLELLFIESAAVRKFQKRRI